MSGRGALLNRLRVHAGRLQSRGRALAVPLVLAVATVALVTVATAACGGSGAKTPPSTTSATVAAANTQAPPATATAATSPSPTVVAVPADLYPRDISTGSVVDATIRAVVDQDTAALGKLFAYQKVACSSTRGTGAPPCNGAADGTLVDAIVSRACEGGWVSAVDAATANALNPQVQPQQFLYGVLEVDPQSSHALVGGIDGASFLLLFQTPVPGQHGGVEPGREFGVSADGHIVFFGIGCGAQAPAMLESHTSFVVTGTLLPPRAVASASPTPAQN